MTPEEVNIVGCGGTGRLVAEGRSERVNSIRFSVGIYMTGGPASFSLTRSNGT